VIRHGQLAPILSHTGGKSQLLRAEGVGSRKQHRGPAKGSNFARFGGETTRKSTSILRAFRRNEPRNPGLCGPQQRAKFGAILRAAKTIVGVSVANPTGDWLIFAESAEQKCAGHHRCDGPLLRGGVFNRAIVLIGIPIPRRSLHPYRHPSALQSYPTPGANLQSKIAASFKPRKASSEPPGSSGRLICLNCARIVVVGGDSCRRWARDLHYSPSNDGTHKLIRRVD
jgi:hypothetical protein